jgi:hypothetical protein
MVGGTRWATGHFFALNLKSQSLFPLVLADRVARKKEHDIRALKRQSVAMLRQGAGQGRKVLWVWDKAGVDFPFWQERKASGIYFLSLRKEGMCLEVEKERAIDFTQQINLGDAAADLHGAATLHAGDVQAHPLAARPLASPDLAFASPAPPPLPLRQTLAPQSAHQWFST